MLANTECSMSSHTESILAWAKENLVILLSDSFYVSKAAASLSEIYKKYKSDQLSQKVITNRELNNMLELLRFVKSRESKLRHWKINGYRIGIRDKAEQIVHKDQYTKENILNLDEYLKRVDSYKIISK